MNKNPHVGRVAPVLAGAVALALVSVPAHGHEMDRDDDSADVVLLDDPDDPEAGATVDAEWSNGDIVGLRAAHGHRRVKARVTFTDLSADPDSGRSFYHLVRIRTPKANYQVLGFDHEGEGEDHDFTLIRGDIVQCKGLTADVDLEQDTVRVRVPRGCLGRPRWVRVGATTISFIETATDLTDLRSDAALAEGTDTDEDPLGPIPLLGRRLRRC